MRLVRFLTVMFLGIISGMSISHAVQSLAARMPDAATWLQVQQTVVTTDRVMLGLEVATLFLLALTAFVVRRDRRTLVVTIASALAIAGMTAIWVAWIQPITTEMSTWTVATVAADRVDLRDRWVFLQLASAGLAAVAFALFVHSVLPRAERRLTTRRVERMLADAMDSTIRSARGVRAVAMWEMRAAAVRRR